MKPFDLEAALDGAPVQTRDGRPVTQLTHFTVASDYSLAGVIEGYLYQWKLDGSLPSSLDDSRLDLVMAPVKKTGWVARLDDSKIIKWIYDTEEAAQAEYPGALSYHEITWEE
jgi:hypothetical protein